MILAALALFASPAVPSPSVQPAVAPRTIPNALTTGVKLTVGTDGRVEHCVVTMTSGWPALDPGLCRILSSVRFQPAKDSGGELIDATYEFDMKWNPPRF